MYSYLYPIDLPYMTFMLLCRMSTKLCYLLCPKFLPMFME